MSVFKGSTAKFPLGFIELDPIGWDRPLLRLGRALYLAGAGAIGNGFLLGLAGGAHVARRTSSTMNGSGASRPMRPARSWDG